MPGKFFFQLSREPKKGRFVSKASGKHHVHGKPVRRLPQGQGQGGLSGEVEGRGGPIGLGLAAQLVDPTLDRGRLW